MGGERKRERGRRSGEGGERMNRVKWCLGRRQYCPSEGQQFAFGETLMVAGEAADVRIR